MNGVKINIDEIPPIENRLLGFLLLPSLFRSIYALELNAGKSLWTSSSSEQLKHYYEED